MFRRKLPIASKIYIAAAMLCGAIAFLLFKSEEAKVQALVPKVGAPAAVVEAARDIARGSELAADELKVVKLPSNFVPPGVIADPDSIVGRVVETDLAAGEPVTSTRLAPVRSGPIAALVPGDLRAFLISVSIPGGSVRAGDRVDVMATFAGGRPHTETVVSDVEVLQVLGGDPASGAGGLPAASGGVTVTTPSAGSTELVLLVSPSDSEGLAYASTFGAISIAIEPAAIDPFGATPGPTPAGSATPTPSP